MGTILIDKLLQACVKQVIWPLLGIDVGALRLPQATMTREQIDQARRRLHETGFEEEISSGKFTLP